jgi:hypothetical protein
VPYQVRDVGWLRRNRDVDPGSAPYRFWPEPRGLLWWAMSRAGDYFFWHPSGSDDVDTWPVVAHFAYHRWHQFDLTMTDLVAAMVTDGIDWSPGYRGTGPLPNHFGPHLGPEEPRPTPVAPLTPSHKGLDRLTAALPATTATRDRAGLWNDVEAPADYRELLDATGPGTLGVLRLLAPGGPDGFDLAAEHTAVAAALTDPPAGLHPDPPGMRLWGRMATGETLWSPSTRRRDPFALLATLLGPPEPDEIDWTDTERKLGRRLPADFKRLFAGYGQTVLDGLSAGDPAEYTQLYNDLLVDDQPPFPVVMCGGTEDRSMVGWNATDPDPDPDAWTVVVQRAGEFESFDGPFVEFVIAVATGRVDLLYPTPSGPVAPVTLRYRG